MGGEALRSLDEMLLRHTHRQQRYMPPWDNPESMDDTMCALLNSVCEAYNAGGSHKVSYRVMWRDEDEAWTVLVAYQRGLVDLAKDIRERSVIVIPRYPTLARHKTHGFKPVPKTGDPAIATPHRPRAINLDD